MRIGKQIGEPYHEELPETITIPEKSEPIPEPDEVLVKV